MIIVILKIHSTKQLKLCKIHVNTHLPTIEPFGFISIHVKHANNI